MPPGASEEESPKTDEDAAADNAGHGIKDADDDKFKATRLFVTKAASVAVPSLNSKPLPES
jgi:hypothetical protein